MRIMTGFGRSEGRVGAYRVSVELTSVNRKGLDFHVSVPRGWSPLEREFPRLAEGRVSRGSVQGTVAAERDEAGTTVGSLPGDVHVLVHGRLVPEAARVARYLFEQFHGAVLVVLEHPTRPPPRPCGARWRR